MDRGTDGRMNSQMIGGKERWEGGVKGEDGSEGGREGVRGMMGEREREKNRKEMGKKWRGREEEVIEKYSLETCSQQ